MKTTWIDADRLDRRDVAGLTALYEAAREVDTSAFLPPLTSTAITARLRHGWDGDAPEVAVVRDDRGRIIGALELWLPSWDNAHVGHLDVTVDPRLRRQGIGRMLFETGVARTRELGRTLIRADCLDQPAGIDFLTTMGLERASAEVIRRQDLRTVDWDQIDRHHREAVAAATGYELLRIAGPVPEDLLPGVVEMTAAINDAPIDALDIEDEVFSPERIRAFEAAQETRLRRYYRVVARHRDSGVLAGHTIVSVRSELPWSAEQADTSVLRAHRGHRLGMLLKADMLRWLTEEEPQVQTIITTNAGTNEHMIKVNEQLGYEVVGTWLEWQRRL